MFGFGLINKGIDSVTGMIKGSIDGAINRVDTLNNATNTFKNMKFDDASINKVFGKVAHYLQLLKDYQRLSMMQHQMFNF